MQIIVPLLDGRPLTINPTDSITTAAAVAPGFAYRTCSYTDGAAVVHQVALPKSTLDAMLLAAKKVTSAVNVNGTTGAAIVKSGFVSATARTSAGVYTVTLSAGLTFGKFIAIASGGGTTYAAVSATPTSATNVAVKVFDAAGAAVDADFCLLIVPDVA